MTTFQEQAIAAYRQNKIEQRALERERAAEFAATATDDFKLRFGIALIFDAVAPNKAVAEVDGLSIKARLTNDYGYPHTVFYLQTVCKDCTSPFLTPVANMAEIGDVLENGATCGCRKERTEEARPMWQDRLAGMPFRRSL